jgi:mRNA interferase MazF
MEKPSNIKYSFVLVSFPFEDFKTSKVRPALCLTEPVGDYEHIVLAFISSKLPDILLDSDQIIRFESQMGKTSGLMVDSVVRFHKIVVIPKSLIKRRLGELDSEGIKFVKTKIKALFGV